MDSFEKRWRRHGWILLAGDLTAGLLFGLLIAQVIEPVVGALFAIPFVFLGGMVYGALDITREEVRDGR